MTSTTCACNARLCILHTVVVACCFCCLTTALLTGTFGRVLECWDRKTNEYVAVKIVKNVEKYRHAAMIEVCNVGNECSKCVLLQYGSFGTAAMLHVCNASGLSTVCMTCQPAHQGLLKHAANAHMPHGQTACVCLSLQLEVLNTLEHNDPQTLNHCVKLKEWFDYRGHVCMVRLQGDFHSAV